MLQQLSPVLLPEVFVFCSFPEDDEEPSVAAKAIASFRESEGITLVLDIEHAQEVGCDCSEPFRCITLELNSSLQAVGLTAAVSSALAQQGISANVIAAYYHDHIFVPSGRAAEALEVLRSLSASAAR